MKKILVFSILLFRTVLGLCQTDPTVTMSGTFNTDPTISVGYVIAVTDGSFTTADSFTRQPIVWLPTGPTTGTIPQGGLTTSVIWQNTPNSPQKKIKATVTYKSFKKVPAPDKVVSDERIVTVKYLSPVTGLIFSGGGVSPTNPANNTTITIPCNAGTISLNATQATPLTDPSSAITYTWTLPNPIMPTSTGTITFDGSGTSDGIIKVSAKRNDGSFVTEFTVNFVRPRVNSIALSGAGVYPSGVSGNNDGYTEICAGTSKNVTITAAGATTFSWTLPTGSISASPTNSSIASISSNSSTGGSITASVDNACLSPKTAILYVQSTTPSISGSTINGVSNAGSTFILFGTSANIAVSTPGFGTIFTWVKNAPFNSNNIYPNYNTCLAYLAPNSYVNVTANTSNNCGSGQSRNFSIYRPTMGMMVSPNPATTTLSVTMDKVVASSFLKTMNIVSDRGATVVRTFDVGNAQKSKYFEQNEKVDFDVANLPRGTYYLIATYTDGKTDKETIILR